MGAAGVYYTLVTSILTLTVSKKEHGSKKNTNKGWWVSRGSPCAAQQNCTLALCTVPRKSLSCMLHQVDDWPLRAVAQEKLIIQELFWPPRNLTMLICVMVLCSSEEWWGIMIKKVRKCIFLIYDFISTGIWKLLSGRCFVACRCASASPGSSSLHISPTRWLLVWSQVSTDRQRRINTNNF